MGFGQLFCFGVEPLGVHLHCGVEHDMDQRAVPHAQALWQGVCCVFVSVRAFVDRIMGTRSSDTSFNGWLSVRIYLSEIGVGPLVAQKCGGRMLVCICIGRCARIATLE